MRIESEKSRNNLKMAFTLHGELLSTEDAWMIVPFVLALYALSANLRSRAPVRAENFDRVCWSRPVAFLLATETIVISERAWENATNDYTCSISPSAAAIAALSGRRKRIFTTVHKNKFETHWNRLFFDFFLLNRISHESCYVTPSRYREIFPVLALSNVILRKQPLAKQCGMIHARHL